MGEGSTDAHIQTGSRTDFKMGNVRRWGRSNQAMAAVTGPKGDHYQRDKDNHPVDTKQAALLASRSLTNLSPNRFGERSTPVQS